MAKSSSKTDTTSLAIGLKAQQLATDKLRGGYYTPPQLAAWLSSWAIRHKTDTILEPSCGNGAFLEAALDRLLLHGASKEEIARQLVGVEIIGNEANSARAKIQGKLGRETSKVVQQGDFFAWWQQPQRRQFDAVIGNPPFIRYQTFPEIYRTRAMSIMAELGMRPNRLTNIWVP